MKSKKKAMPGAEEIIMAENLYRRATKEEREAAWAESRLFYEIQEATNRDVARQEGLAEGEKRGRTEGAAQKQREIAKNLLAKKMPVPEIAEITGLTIHEIEEL